MHLSKRILLLMLSSQVLILALAFIGFSRKIEQSQLQREASIFDVTTNLQYSQLLHEPAGSAIEAMIKTARHVSKMPGMIGVCLYNEIGRGILCVPDWLPPEETASLSASPRALFRERFQLADPAVQTSGKTSIRALQIDIPLLGSKGQVVAHLRFYRYGDSLTVALREQKRLLLLLAILAMTLTCAITTFTFQTYDRHLRRNQNILKAKNEELLSTQRHLLLSSQMTAIGIMTAHLIHDLKSYSSRINMSLLKLCRRHNGQSQELQETAQCAADMDKHIRQFLGFLRSDAANFKSTYTVDELIAIVHQKIKPVADKGGVTARFENRAVSFEIDFKKGNFLILILQNLLHNAVEATPAKGGIALEATREGNSAVFLVTDEGPGIPVEERRTIFMPQHSFKEGGTGLGLAISAQMAYHIGAGISLESSCQSGSIFKVILPVLTSHQANPQSE